MGHKKKEENENRLLAKENAGLKQNIEELALAYLALSEGFYKILGKGQSDKKMKFLVFIHIPSVVKPVHIFMARNRVSKSCLMAELCFHRFFSFLSRSIYIFGIHHKQCASD